MAGPTLFSSRLLERWLSERLVSLHGERPRIRVVRSAERRALVDVPHVWAGRARAAWNGEWSVAEGMSVRVQTHRTWGTLTKGKQWLRTPLGPRDDRSIK